MKSEYVSKNEFHQYLLQEIWKDNGENDVVRLIQQFEKQANNVTRRKKRSANAGNVNYNLLNSPSDEPHVEFFNPELRSTLEAKDDLIRQQTGNKGAAPGGDSWIWLTSYSRIPVS